MTQVMAIVGLILSMVAWRTGWKARGLLPLIVPVLTWMAVDILAQQIPMVVEGPVVILNFLSLTALAVMALIGRGRKKLSGAMRPLAGVGVVADPGGTARAV